MLIHRQIRMLTIFHKSKRNPADDVGNGGECGTCTDDS